MGELRPHYSVIDARDRLLEGALTAFAELGFHGATIRDIAQRAGVSQGLISHHFCDKETLWDLVGERVRADFLDFMEPTLQADPVDAETVPRILEAYMLYWQAHPTALRLQLWRVLGARESERLERADVLNRRIVPIFAQAQAAGFIRDDIPAGQAMTTAGSLIQYRLHSRLEMDNAIAVSGAGAPDDAAFLRYACSLIAPRTPPRKAAPARRKALAKR